MINPSRRRWIILTLIFLAIVLNYIDRQILSILKPTLKAEFGFDDRGYSLLANVFTVGYACMYPVAGWLVDRFGPRLTLLTGLLAWSTACLFSAFTKTLGQFAFTRIMLGLAEPIAFPAQLRVVVMWFSGKMRATANSVSVSGSAAGAILAPPLVAWLAIKYDWHAAFIVPGVIGLCIAALWFFLYRAPPADWLVDGLTAAEKENESAFTWPQLWRTRTLWGILLIRFITDPVWYFCIFWFPGYLQENSGLSLKNIGMLGWIPFVIADIGGIVSAVWSDWMVKRGVEPLRARKIMLTIMAVAAPVCILTPHLPYPAVTLAIFSMVAVSCESWLFNLPAVIMETFPARNVAGVLGIAGCCGAAGAVLFNTFVGEMLSTFGPVPIFTAMAVLYPIAIPILWTMARPEHPSRA
jgi:ACS family hexuronate transporter-like MFS transporter